MAVTIKLSDAQREALKKIYAHSQFGHKLDYKWASQPTRLSLLKLGLISGVVTTWGSSKHLNDPAITPAGIEYGKRAFAMDGFIELMAAYVAECKHQTYTSQIINTSNAIKGELDIVSYFEFSKDTDGDYIAHSRSKIDVEVRRYGYSWKKQHYVMNFYSRGELNAENGVKLANDLVEAARLCNYLNAKLKGE